MSDESTGSLSVDAAVNLLASPAEEPKKQPEASAEPPEDQGSPAEPEDASEAPEPGDGETAEAPEPAEAQALEPPQWWDAEDKAHFSTLTPEAQAVVLKNEEKRESVLQKEKGRALEARKAAEAEIAGFQNIVSGLNQWLPTAVEQFKSRWGDNPDWGAAAREYGAEQALQWRSEYEQEQKTLHQAIQSKQLAEQQAHALFMRERTEQLVSICPDLSPDKTGEKALENQTALSQYLLKGGARPDRVTKMDALEMSIAWKAFQYDQGKQALAAPKPKPPPQRNVAPTGSTSQRSESMRAQDLLGKLSKTGKQEDAVAVLLARQSQRK